MAYTDLPIYLIAQVLEDDGVGTFATDIFISKEPDSPDNAITIYSNGGIPDECLTHGERSGEILSFQVRVRNNDYLTAQAVMESVRASIEKGNKTLVDSGGTNRLKIWMTSLPIDLKRDSTNRAIVTANFNVMRSYS